jgi:hypothetical protein
MLLKKLNPETFKTQFTYLMIFLNRPLSNFLSTFSLQKTLIRRRSFFPQIQTRRRDVDSGSGGATSLLGSVSPWLVFLRRSLRSVSVSPPVRFFFG